MQARIQDFCQGRAQREWWPYLGWEWAIFNIRKHIFATFQNVYCHTHVLCLNGVKQPFKRHQCPFFMPLRRGGAGPSVPGVAARPSAPWIRAWDHRLSWQNQRCYMLKYLIVTFVIVCPSRAGHMVGLAGTVSELFAKMLLCHKTIWCEWSEDRKT